MDNTADLRVLLASQYPLIMAETRDESLPTSIGSYAIDGVLGEGVYVPFEAEAPEPLLYVAYDNLPRPGA